MSIDIFQHVVLETSNQSQAAKFAHHGSSLPHVWDFLIAEYHKKGSLLLQINLDDIFSFTDLHLQEQGMSVEDVDSTV